jgi:hypothetical protein
MHLLGMGFCFVGGADAAIALQTLGQPFFFFFFRGLWFRFCRRRRRFCRRRFLRC